MGGGHASKIIKGLPSPIIKLDVRLKITPSFLLSSGIFDALDSEKQDECWLHMPKDLMRARKGDNIKDVYEPMRLRGFSQMPVYDSERYLGIMTERRPLDLRKPYQTLLVEDGTPHPKETSYDAVIKLIRQFPAVMVVVCAERLSVSLAGRTWSGTRRSKDRL